MTESGRSAAESSAVEIIVHRASTPHLALEYPSLLQIEQLDRLDGVDLVLAATETALPFRPNLVATSVPSTAPLVDASVVALLAVEQQHPGARLVGVDVFHPAGASVEDTPIGRTIVFTYPATERLEVMVKKWVFATGEHHLHLSASFLPSQALIVEQTFDWIVAHVQFAASPEVLLAAAVSPSEAGAPVDEEASSRVGFPLEDLAVFPSPVPVAADRLPISGVEAVAEAWGVRLTQPKVLSAVVTRGSDQGFYAAYRQESGVLVLRSAGASACDLDPTRFEAYPLTAERLPGDASAWMGAAPAFRFGGPARMPMSEYEGRVVEAVGSDAWTEMRVEIEGEQLVAVSVPDSGLFEAVSPEEGVIELDALPSARLFELLLRQVGGVLGSEEQRAV